MKLEEIKKKVSNPDGDRWLIWCGYVLDEDEEKRELEYFGRFVKTKKGVIGLVRSMINNTAPYRIIIQDVEPFRVDPSKFQAELKDFFSVEES